MKFNQDILWNWLVTLPTWAAVAVGVLLAIVAILLARAPLKMIKHMDTLERCMCKPGAFETSLGCWPSWLTLCTTLWIAVPSAFRLFRIHNASYEPYVPGSTFWVFGFDFSETVPYSGFFGTIDCIVPSDIAFYLDAFARLWFVPIGCAVLFFLFRIGKFKGPGSAATYLLSQLLFVNALYWGYGFYLLFILVPVLVALGIILIWLFFGGTGSSSSSSSSQKSEESNHGGSGGGASSSSGSASGSGIGVEHEDMFNEGLKINQSLGPDIHLDHDESQDSIYGNTYVNHDNGKEYRVIETDAFGHPTKVEEKWP